MDEDAPDAAEIAVLFAALMVALLGTLPKPTAGRLLVAMSVAFERLERSRRTAKLADGKTVRGAREWFSNALPAILRAVR